MQEFAKFVLRAVGQDPRSTIIGALLMALGSTWQSVLAAWGSPPWYLTHGVITPALFFGATVFFAWVAFKQSRIEIAIPDRLMRRSRTTFAEIADVLAGVPALGLTRDEVLHRLLRAMWLGDFENGAGKTRLMASEVPATQRFIDGEWVPLTSSDEADSEQDVDVDLPLEPRSRRWLLGCGWDMGLGDIYPTLAAAIPAVRDESQAWSSVKTSINFRRLAFCAPNQYDEVFRTAYLEPLMMTRRDLVRWFRRVRDGRYEP
jgi:hypothetical protein